MKNTKTLLHGNKTKTKSTDFENAVEKFMSRTLGGQKTSKSEKVKCDYCEIFVKTCHIDQHFAEYHQKTICEQCGSEFESQRKCKRHIRDAHKPKRGINTELKECEKCDKKFKSRKNLRIHIKTIHDQIKDEMCSACGKAFSRQDLLKLHTQRVHEGRRDHKCHKCGTAFSGRSILNRHIKTVHEGLKPYRCLHCEKAYGQNGDLKKHVKRAHPHLQ